MALIWIFSLVIVLVLAMSFLPHGRYYVWSWNFLLVAVAIYLGLYFSSGSPRNTCLIATLSQLHGELELLHHESVKNQYLYLLVRAQDEDPPLYVALPWSAAIVKNLSTATMKATQQGSVVMVKAEMLSRCMIEENQEDGQRGKPTRGTADGRSETDKEQSGQRPGGGGDEDDGLQMFYPRPVVSDPLKSPPIRIEGSTPEESANRHGF